jgi:hypothetical protein
MKLMIGTINNLHPRNAKNCPGGDPMSPNRRRAIVSLLPEIFLTLLCMPGIPTAENLSHEKHEAA